MMPAVKQLKVSLAAEGRREVELAFALEPEAVLVAASPAQKVSGSASIRHLKLPFPGR